MIGESWKPKREEEDVYPRGRTIYGAAAEPNASTNVLMNKQMLEELASEAAENGDEGMFDEYHRRLNAYVD